MPRCDICNGRSEVLNKLRDIYQTKEIVDVCFDCEAIINEQLHKIQISHGKAQESLLKRFISVLRKDKFNGGRND